MTYSFGENTKEYSAKHGRELPVWRSPKYEEARAKAVEILDSGKYGLKPSDFWILMNVTKSEKMAYTGLIISHNGCLKINDHLDRRFDPACVTEDKDGYKNSLVFSYRSPEQGIFEVGEVSKENCTNAYPYAMAFKRLFDRVVLKLSRLAYSGIYSDSESEEFSQNLDNSAWPADAQPKTKNPESGYEPGMEPAFKTLPVPKPICADCGAEISVKVHDWSVKAYKRPLCMVCQKAAMKQEKEHES